MAIKILTTDATLSSGTGWYRTEYENFAISGKNANSTAGTLTQEVTFANAGNQVGIYLLLRSTISTGSFSYTLTIKLQENTGSWVDRTTDTFTLTEANYSGGCLNCYFPLTTYPVTTASSTWRYSVTCTSSNIQWWYSTGPSYCMAAVLDASTAAPTTGDSIIIADNKTLTFDQSISLATIYMGKDATFQWENPPAASYTLTITGQYAFICYSNSRIVIGSSGSPIPYAQRAIINHTYAGGDLIYALAWHQIYSPDAIRQFNNILEMYGAECTNMRGRIAADATSGQANIVTTDDLSTAWQIGDTVTLFGKETTSADTTTYTISGISGTTITLSANLNYKLFAGGAILNYTHADRTLGIKLSGNTTTICKACSGEVRYKSIIMCGVMMYYYANYWYYTSIYHDDPATYVTLMRSIMSYSSDTQANHLAYLSFYQGLSIGGTFENLHRFNGASIVAGVFKITNGVGLTVKDITAKNSSSEGNGQVALYSNNDVTLSGIVSTPHITSYYGQNALRITANQVTASDIFCYGSRETIYLTVNDGTFTNVIADGASGTYSYNLYLRSSCVDVTFNSCNFGVNKTAGVNDVYVYDSTLAKVIFNSCKVGTNGVGGTSGMLLGSYLGFHEFQTIVNNHITYFKYGTTQSTGDALADTTAHTSGTGKFAIRFLPNSSTSNLTWQFNVPTGDIKDKTMNVAVWCKINSATYYAGTHQLPRLTVNFDNGTEGYCQAAEMTDWQLLSVTFIPTTTYGQITVTLSGRTDATSTDAYVYWDDFNVAYPADVVLDLGGLDNWADAMPVTPPFAIPISANTVALAVWQQLTGTSYGTSTMGEFLKALPTVSAPTATVIADAVWDEQTSDHTTAGSTGKAVSDGSKKIVVIDEGEVPIYESQLLMAQPQQVVFPPTNVFKLFDLEAATLLLNNLPCPRHINKLSQSSLPSHA